MAQLGASNFGLSSSSSFWSALRRGGVSSVSQISGGGVLPYIPKICRDVKMPGERHFERVKGTTMNTDSEEKTTCTGGNSAMSRHCATALEKSCCDLQLPLT